MYKDIFQKDVSLRSYQQKAKEQIFTAWDECNDVMFQMPTGTGKTRLFTSIISDVRAWGVRNNIDTKILIVAHRIELIEQISESLAKYKVGHGIIAGGISRNLQYTVQVASIQTITHHNNLDLANALNINFIIIDEAHHSVANSYRKLWQMYPDAKKLGVTATPWRMNNSGFANIFDQIIVSQPVKDFIQEGWLSPYSYYSINDKSSIRKEIDSINEFDIEGDYKISALENKIDTLRIRAQLLDSYLKFAKGKKGIIYSISRKHSDHICEEYRNAGINIVRIDSKTPKSERKLYVQRFRKGLIDIIVNVDIFSEGFDCPDIEFIQLARPTKSLVKYLQQVGRGLRPTEGKTTCMILDNVGLHFLFGLPDSEHDWEESFIGEPKVRSRKKSQKSVEIEPSERSFEEGNDEMLLIKGEEPLFEKWTEKDIELLKELYVERQCPLEVLAAVFKKNIEDIQKQVELLEDNNNLQSAEE